MSEPGPEQPALDAEHTGDAYLNYMKKMKLQRGDISNMINISKLPNDNESVQFKTTVESDRLTARIEKIMMKIKNRFSLLDKNIEQLNKLVGIKEIKVGEIIKAAMNQRQVEIDKTILKYKAMTEQEKNNKMEMIRELEQEQAEERVKIQNKRDQEAAEKKEIESEIKKLKEENKRIYQRIKDMQKNAAHEKKELVKFNEDLQSKMAKEKNYLVADIESLRKTLNMAREKSQNEIRGLKQDQTKLIEKIETEMKMNEHKLKKTTRDMQFFFDNLKDILYAKKHPATCVSDPALSSG